MPKGIKILLLLLITGLLIYVKFFGVTKKQKFDKCVKTCRDTLLQESSKVFCEPRCEEITGYKAGEEKTTTKSPIKKTDDKETENKKTEESKTEYYCEWSWPQKVIIKDTKEVVLFCTPQKPYCNKADGSFENVGCCEGYVESTKKHFNCTLLPELL